MGKNYSETDYKKTYGSDYVKSYENRREAKRLYEERARSYREATQSVKPYNKAEKGKRIEQGANTSAVDVRPEGNKSPTRRITPPKTQTNQNTQSYQPKSAQTSRKPEEVNKPKAEVIVPKQEVVQPTVVTPPLFVAPVEQVIVTESQKQKRETPRNYEAYRNMVTPPVMPLGNGKYREMSRKEEVDEREARKILGYADYKPKEQFNLLLFFVIAGVLGFSMSIVGPICIVAWGFLAKSKSTTEYEKKLSLGKLSVSMPATEQDKEKYEKRGKLYVNVGAVIGVIQLARLLDFV